MTTKYELQQKRDRLQKQLNEVNEALEKMNKTLCLDNNEKPFSKYSISEMSDLLDCSEMAYNWLNENKDKSIIDFNNSQPKAYRVVLEK